MPPPMRITIIVRIDRDGSHRRIAEGLATPTGIAFARSGVGIIADGAQAVLAVDNGAGLVRRISLDGKDSRPFSPELQGNGARAWRKRRSACRRMGQRPYLPPGHQRTIIFCNGQSLPETPFQTGFMRAKRRLPGAASVIRRIFLQGGDQRLECAADAHRWIVKIKSGISRAPACQ